MLLSPFTSPSPFSPPPSSIILFSMSASPLLLCEQIHRYHLSRVYIYALIYNICFSLSDLLQIGPRFIQLIRTENSKVMHIWIGDAKEPMEK